MFLAKKGRLGNLGVTQNSVPALPVRRRRNLAVRAMRLVRLCGAGAPFRPFPGSVSERSPSPEPGSSLSLPGHKSPGKTNSIKSAPCSVKPFQTIVRSRAPGIFSSGAWGIFSVFSICYGLARVVVAKQIHRCGLPARIGRRGKAAACLQARRNSNPGAMPFGYLLNVEICKKIFLVVNREGGDCARHRAGTRDSTVSGMARCQPSCS